MNIALVSPEYYDIAHFGTKRKEIPPFGVLYLAAVLQNRGFSVALYRVSLEKYSFNFSAYDVVGFSISSSVAYPLIKKVRENSLFNPESLLVAGGIHTTLFPKEVINELGVHISCIGEGENTFVEIINNYQKKEFRDIHGIVYKNNNIFYNTPNRDCIEDLDTLPFPSRQLLPLEDIVMNDRLSNTNLKTAHILFSRGCPYSCNFCANLEHNIRYRSGTNIRQELVHLIEKYQIEGFCVTDDNFIIDKKRVKDILNNIADLGLKWSTLSRVNTVDKELLTIMKNSGCIEIKYGIESGSQRILNAMNKQITIEQINKTINLTYDLGIKTKAFLLHGFPGENLESTNETIRLLEELKEKIGRVSLFRFVPLPGSHVWNNNEQYNLSLPSDFEEIYIYNNDNKWWGNYHDHKELEESYKLIESYIKENWEKF